MSEEFWYRYEDRSYSTIIDADREIFGSEVKLECRQYRVIKHTPKGVWLDVYGRKRFVLNSAIKRFACSTRVLALESFIARKDRQIGIYTSRLMQAKQMRQEALRRLS